MPVPVHKTKTPRKDSHKTERTTEKEADDAGVRVNSPTLENRLLGEDEVRILTRAELGRELEYTTLYQESLRQAGKYHDDNLTLQSERLRRELADLSVPGLDNDNGVRPANQPRGYCDDDEDRPPAKKMRKAEGSWYRRTDNRSGWRGGACLPC